MQTKEYIIGRHFGMRCIDFTLSNARRFYSSMENPLDGKGLTTGGTPLLVVLTALSKI